MRPRRRVSEAASDITSAVSSDSASGDSSGAATTSDSSCEKPTNPLAHLVALVTGYHWLLGLKSDLQHLLPGAKQAFPQQPPPSPWHGKVFPLTFTQQVSPLATHTSPQQLSPPAQVKLSPLRLRQ